VKKEAPYLVFYQKLFNQNGSTRVARAVIKAILLDEQKKPLDIPDDMVNLIAHKQEGNG